MKTLFKVGATSFLLISILNMSGCSVFMAAKQPEKKDTKMLKIKLEKNG